MSRFARTRRVFFFEEPVFEDTEPHLKTRTCPESGTEVQTPVLPRGMNHEQTVQELTQLLRSAVQRNEVSQYVLWYYTPMALEFSAWMRPHAIVYDCMDELSAFANAPAAMCENERALFHSADLVFTGGASLFESKRTRHPAVHLFPSSVDASHFAQARHIAGEPADQAAVPHPRLGYAGVIDERMDLQLLRDAAAARPDWQFILVGPVAKIDPASLPQAPNVHYLGLRPYSELPAYFSGWDAALLPFALNPSTEFISPTKTPEYLAAGLPVISTPIRDVIHPYEDLGLVRIARSAAEFVSIAESLIAERPGEEFLRRVDQFLSQSSWDDTWSRMNALINEAVTKNRRARKRIAAQSQAAESPVEEMVRV